MSQKYEIVYIFDSALEETEINERLERFHDLLKTSESPTPITDISHWGKRTLAYPIKKKEQGHYVVAQFETEQAALAEFERAIKLDDGVLRHLIVINDGLSTVPASSATPGQDRGDGRSERDDHTEDEG
ncbi:MAG: 30S ribosomal protein S6 [Gemmatimonadales bacterium]|jgi:small subunit ribosomal protein S6